MRTPLQPLTRLLAVSLLCSLPVWLGSCQQTPKPATARPVLRLPPILTPPILTLPNENALPPMSADDDQTTYGDDTHPPYRYEQWLKQHDSRVIEQYRIFLKQHRIKHLPPMYQLLTSARDWENCNREPYNVPPQPQWDNMVATLKLLDRLKKMGILTHFELTSVYRDPELNACAGGSLGSKHVLNAAVDIRLRGPQAEPIGRSEAQARLCQFWQDHGESLNMGMGLYPTGQIHIDTQGYRTWGVDHRSNSAFCVKKESFWHSD